MTNDAAIYDKLFYNLNTTGPVLSPFDSYLLLRGLKTLALLAWSALLRMRKK